MDKGDVTASAKPRITKQDMICDVVAAFGGSQMQWCFGKVESFLFMKFGRLI